MAQLSAWGGMPKPNRILPGTKYITVRPAATIPNSIDVGNTAKYTLTGLDEGVTYYLAATAYDQDDIESDFSEELVPH